ncbi:hypothetical protein [Streptomyces sp. NPDC050738]|uniref:hypothetical protein n=1 Tax=Streptomyces sp. NPDC050738 TaxID=3154744 RepID=UPI0034363651
MAGRLARTSSVHRAPAVSKEDTMGLSATRDGTGDHARTPRGTVPRARRGDLLGLLTAEFDGVHDVWRSAAGTVCVAGPEAARAVMGNRHATVAGTSDFFRVRGGVFGPRAAQIRIGRSARALVRRHLDATRAGLPALIAERLAPRNVWPDAGNLLVFRYLRDVLLHPDAPPPLHEAIEAIVMRSVLAGARQRHSPPSRLLFRRRALGVLHTAIRARQYASEQRRGPGEPRDLPDVVLEGSGPGADPRDLAEVHLSFLFAAVGSVGFALGWSLR